MKCNPTILIIAGTIMAMTARAWGLSTDGFVPPAEDSSFSWLSLLYGLLSLAGIAGCCFKNARRQQNE